MNNRNSRNRYNNNKNNHNNFNNYYENNDKNKIIQLQDEIIHLRDINNQLNNDFNNLYQQNQLLIQENLYIKCLLTQYTIPIDNNQILDYSNTNLNIVNENVSNNEENDMMSQITDEIEKPNNIKINELYNNIQQLKNNLEQIEFQSNQNKDKYEKELNINNDLKKTIENLNNKNNELNNTINDLNNQFEIEKNKYNEIVELHKKNIDENNILISKNNEKINTLENKLNSKNIELNNIKISHNKIMNDKDILISNNNEKINNLQNQLNIKNTEYNNVLKEVENLNKRIHNIDNTTTTTNDHIPNSTNNNKKNKNKNDPKIEELKISLRSKEDDILMLNSEIENLNSNINKLNESLLMSQNQVDVQKKTRKYYYDLSKKRDSEIENLVIENKRLLNSLDLLASRRITYRAILQLFVKEKIDLLIEIAKLKNESYTDIETEMNIKYLDIDKRVFEENLDGMIDIEAYKYEIEEIQSEILSLFGYERKSNMTQQEENEAKMTTILRINNQFYEKLKLNVNYDSNSTTN